MKSRAPVPKLHTSLEFCMLRLLEQSPQPRNVRTERTWMGQQGNDEE